MKKFLHCLTLISLLLPILLGLAYTAGVFYYHDYFDSFGVPYGLFTPDLYSVLLLGGLELENYALKCIPSILSVIFIYLAFLSILDCVAPKIKLLNKIKTSKSTPDKNSFQYMGVSMALPIISGAIVTFFTIFIFVEVITFSSEKGKTLGYELKKEIIELSNLKNTKKPTSPKLNVFEINNHKEIGYLVHSDANFMAIFTADKGLVIHKTSRISMITPNIKPI